MHLRHLPEFDVLLKAFPDLLSKAYTPRRFENLITVLTILKHIFYFHSLVESAITNFSYLQSISLKLTFPEFVTP